MKKYKDYLGLVFFMIFSVAFAIGMMKLAPEPKTPTQGIPHNYWVPTKEDPDWTGTTQGEDTTTHSDEDVMWIGGNGDTIWE